MRILVIGSGGREHAIVHRLAGEDPAAEIYVAPGNAGTSAEATNVAIDATDVRSLLTFALEKSMDLTIVGPEQPLVSGITDEFRAHGLSIVGPSASAARLEGSKAFAKDFMRRHGIPTATYESFASNDVDEAVAFIRERGAPIVVKASGLAAGKGAVVCTTAEEAERVARSMLIDEQFGTAGREIVVEEFMQGEEASVFAVCDGESYVLLAPAQDHKQVGEGDTGPNTGGMGAYAPAPIVDATLTQAVETEIIKPTVEGLAKEGTPYNGFLYVGLMIDQGRPRVVEYNCRLGDPEAQVVLPLIAESFTKLMRAAAEGDLQSYGAVEPVSGAAACVVLCSKGYPGPYQKGFRIDGVDSANRIDDVFVCHAGTSRKNGDVVTAGGRVLGVSATGKSLSNALEQAYAAVDLISFEGKSYRRDIGRKGLARLQPA